MSLKIGKIDVLGTLGRGAGSSILKVRRKADTKTYALKVISIESADDRKFLAQARLEFAVASALDHRCLVKAYACEVSRKWFTPTGARVLLEYIDGIPLSECPRLPVQKLVSIFRQVASALRHMHRHGYLHADLKPENIMVTAKGDAKVIDLGLVWRTGQRKNRIQGTLEYLAPEQARDKVVTYKTDIFNLGATMYRCLTGKPAPVPLADGETRLAAVGPNHRIADSLRAADATIPRRLAELVGACLAVDPADRPDEMDTIRHRLGAILESNGAERKRSRDQTSRDSE